MPVGYRNIGYPSTVSWRLRDEAGVDFVRERHGLPPLFDQEPASAAAAASPAPQASGPAPTSGRRRKRGKSGAKPPHAPPATGKRRAAAELEREEVIDLTADDGILQGPSEPAEVDLTGGRPRITRLARFKLCVNDGAFTLRDTLVPDPEGDVGGVIDSRGRDSFVRSLLAAASDTLWPPSEGGGGGGSVSAQVTWDLRGKQILTRAAAIAAGTLVVGRSATERFKSAAAL